MGFFYMSPSMRREWIEIFANGAAPSGVLSPSMRREWIEILPMKLLFLRIRRSPSMRREWIEISGQSITASS